MPGTVHTAPIEGSPACCPATSVHSPLIDKEEADRQAAWQQNIAAIQTLRKQLGWSLTIDEIISARDEGRR